jgi:hypothetical protein
VPHPCPALLAGQGGEVDVLSEVDVRSKITKDSS